jgi:hypothetical protein
MGPGEIAALAAVAVVCLYARRRLPKGEWTWSILGYGYKRPMTVWGIVYVLSGFVVLIWALRVAHVVFYGPD